MIVRAEHVGSSRLEEDPGCGRMSEIAWWWKAERQNSTGAKVE
jgi:hypothetical protein